MCMSEHDHNGEPKADVNTPITLSIPLYWLEDFNADGYHPKDETSCGDKCVCSKRSEK